MIDPNNTQPTPELANDSPWGENYAQGVPEFNPEQVQKFNRMRNLHDDLANKMRAKIPVLEEKVTTDERHAETYRRQLADARRNLRRQESYLEFMRMPVSREDGENRADLIRNYAEKIAETVPDDLPLVFHGTNDIGTVREIIKTGGLLTPEQKGETMQSFAAQIDVTAKTNIRVSCEFAEPGQDSFMPYGAIFAFMPRPEEVETVQNTGDSSEVFGGVDGVSFRDEPDRLYGIITTTENIPRVGDWCKEYGWRTDKVFTHEEFLEKMKEQALQS